MNLKFNEKAYVLVKKLIKNFSDFKVKVIELPNGARIIDCGVIARGSYKAGITASEIAMGAYAKVEIAERFFKNQKFHCAVTDLKKPGVVTLCSQGAFPIFEDQKSPFYISGPGRVLYRIPQEVYDFFEYNETTDKPIFIVEDNEYPDVAFIDRLATKGGIPPERFTFIVVPIPSVSGNVEVAAKTIEDVMFNLLLTSKWDVRKITRAKSITPIMQIFSKEENKIRLTPDDYIFYGGEVELYVDTISSELKNLLPKFVFENTPGFGKLFYEMVKEANGNIRKIRGYPYIFSPAKITVISEKEEEQFTVGHNHMDVLIQKIIDKGS